MRKYYLADSVSRGKVDLRDYEDEILTAVHEVMPNAEVVVGKDSYSVSPTPERGAAIKIGRALSKKYVLGRYCVQIPKLFNSTPMDKKKKEARNDPNKQSCHGGHH